MKAYFDDIWMEDDLNDSPSGIYYEGIHPHFILGEFFVHLHLFQQLIRFPLIFCPEYWLFTPVLAKVRKTATHGDTSFRI
jgi:hypothetical protein